MRALGQKTKRKLVIIGMGIIVVVGAIIFYFNDPATSSFFPPCPFHLITGLWCPGCGSGRALHGLLHGDILHALDLNPLMVLSLPFLGYAGASRLCLYIRGKGLPRILGGRFWGWFVACVVLVYWVARNIAVYPLTVLAP
jgi:hypothetical protein